jgi:ribosomal protein S18 acetylase RimI-like enzyme
MRAAGEFAEIFYLCTDPAQRQRGVATALLGKCCAEARSNGAQRLVLEVRTGNQAAIALYRKHGFAVTLVKQRYYADGEDALLMVKEIGTVGKDL